MEVTPSFSPYSSLFVKSSSGKPLSLQKTPFALWPLALFFSLILSFPYFILFPSKRKFLSDSARSLARFRLPVWVVGISRFPATCRQLQFSYGIFPIYKPDDTEDWEGFIKGWLSSQGISGNLALLTECPSSKHPEINHRLEIIELLTRNKA